MLTTQMVKDWALRCGADAVGIGAMERFEGAPLQFDPRTIFPEAETIIGLAFRVHRGLYRGIEEGTWFAGLPSMGYANINDIFAPMALRNLSSLIEDAGYEAIPYQNTSVRLGTGAGRAVAEGLPKPDVFIHFRIAAYICGMGEIGWSKVFLTPQFGPRQRFAFILTDAPLKPDPVMEPGTLCDRCKLCVKDCPGGAISKDEAIEIEVAGKQIAWGKLDEDKCACVYQTGSPEYGPFMDDETAAKVQEFIDMPPGQERSEMIAYSGGPWGLGRSTAYSKNTWESYHHPGTVCGARGCQRACFIHLEQQGKLSNKFHRPFRIRQPWKLTR
ncbi:(4Fe-4S)-binding protein [bacterium]|nr:(4Fe-4S)-binding protein [bacterium]